jgi:hypothetical protein
MNDAGPTGGAAAAVIDVAAVMVDDRNPWLGLASFTEETQSYFHGREDEVAELARRVQRKLLTVLFGQSGLGKTSILRAGLVPRLRGQGYCPVYVRIAYGRDAPEPSEQIKEAIARTARRSGEWTQAGVAAAGESLWEYMHHRDDVLQDESGNTLIPLLIFDQFEEIFTLAQSDEFGRARAARFVADLADLVENRPPQALEAKLDADDSNAERFDFARSDYRVLLALREDYLAPLEGLKSAMPSITQNRLRLAPMTGTQALTAVMRPGKRLVSEEVAAAIVRFVAGGAELANAEVEPSLLSLICRELNDARIAQGRDEISLDLLAGSHATILSNFYERALADQPPAVRRVIEDVLLTASGFRENIAEERLVSSFKAAGAAPDTLAVLVNRRLLRIEERLDVRRVELTHDVLCGVVKSSRDLRQEREAREATERLLTEQHERELAARRALVRARQVAMGCIVLAAGAVVAATLAYLSTQRAHRAERLAEQTRGQAEQLLGYLTDDFARELESSGRLDVIADLAKREIDYFHKLPAGLKGVDTVRNGALALLQYSKAKRTLGDLDEARSNNTEALNLLEQLRQGGDDSEATAVALARGNLINSRILSNQQDPADMPAAQRAVDVLKPFAEQPNASIAARQAYVEVLENLGALQQQNIILGEKSVISLRQAMQLAAQLGARDLSDMRMAAEFAESGAWLSQALVSLGQIDEAKRVAADSIDLAQKVLELRPGYRLALHALGIMQSQLTELAMSELKPEEALGMGRQGEATALTLVTLDPKNTVTFNNLAVIRKDLGDASWAAGQLHESLDYYQKGVADSLHAAKAGANFVLNQLYPMSIMAIRLADIGDASADKTLSDLKQIAAGLHDSEPKDSVLPLFGDCNLQLGQAGVALRRADYAAARRIGAGTVAVMRPVKPRAAVEEAWKNWCTYYPDSFKGLAEFLLGDYAASEHSLREALEVRTHWPIGTDDDRREVAEASTLLALTLAGQHRDAEAQKLISPVLKFHRQLASHNRGDQQQHLELARTLYAQAIIDPSHRTALLHEAASLLDSLPPQMQALHSARLWRDRIREATR